MPLIHRDTLLKALSPPIDASLCESMLDEFVSSERRFIQRDWEPAQLDGGQFAEIAARIYYSMDSAILNKTKQFSDCISYIENEKNTHCILPRSDALHVCRVLRTIYKFRSQRGAIHISINYTPNHMDSKLILENVRWVMNETLRIFWQGDKLQVEKAIRELLQFDVPMIGVFGEKIIVQRTDLSAEEEVIMLLHYSGDVGFSRNEIGRAAQTSPASVTRAIQRLVAPNCRQAIQLVNGNYRLTDVGSKRVREKLSGKFALL